MEKVWEKYGVVVRKTIRNGWKAFNIKTCFNANPRNSVKFWKNK